MVVVLDDRASRRKLPSGNRSGEPGWVRRWSLVALERSGGGFDAIDAALDEACQTALH